MKLKKWETNTFDIQVHIKNYLIVCIDKSHCPYCLWYISMIDLCYISFHASHWMALSYVINEDNLNIGYSLMFLPKHISGSISYTDKWPDIFVVFYNTNTAKHFWEKHLHTCTWCTEFSVLYMWKKFFFSLLAIPNNYGKIRKREIYQNWLLLKNTLL